VDVWWLFARIGKSYLKDRSYGLYGHCATAVREVTDMRVATDLLAAIGDRPAAFEILSESRFDDSTTVLECLHEMLTNAVYGLWLENPYIKFWHDFSADVETSEITQLADAACSYFLLFPAADDEMPQTVQSATRAIMELKWDRKTLDQLFIQLFATPGIVFEQAPEGDTVEDTLVRSIAEGIVQLMLTRPDIQAEQERRLAGAH
jgi:hypothetical protein